MASCVNSSERKRTEFGSSSMIEEDRISNLPDPILSQILSLLKTKEAVATSILSKTWRFLWTSIPNLDFDDHCSHTLSKDDYCNCKFIFRNYVGWILYLHNSPSIHKFSLKLSYFRNCVHINEWICDVLDRNLRELELMFHPDCIELETELPDCLFHCNTLEVLKLVGPFQFKIPKVNSICLLNLGFLHIESVHCYEIPAEDGFYCFPLLHTLHIVCVEFENNAVDNLGKLLRNCPLLEHLYLKTGKKRYFPSMKIDLCAPTLRSAEIDFQFRGCIVQIDAPKLQYFTIRGWDLDSELLFKEPCSLIEATSFEVFPGGYKIYSADHLIKAVEKSQSLLLSSDTVEAIIFGEVIFPLFCNLTRLELLYINCYYLNVLQSFIEHSINLQCLVIRKVDPEECSVEWKWLPEFEGLPKCLLSTLKRVEIYDAVGCVDEIALIEYMLKNAKVLENMTIQTSSLVKEKYQLLQKIVLFPRGSTVCEIDFS